jgi:hypothetical protein
VLTIIAFASEKDGTLITVPNFFQAKRIQMALMPCQCKHGDVLNNSRLYSAWIKTRKLWMGYLSREFYNNVVAENIKTNGYD